ncbi:MAG: DUF4142 domain-containing protein [Ginsengibacter sp.]
MKKLAIPVLFAITILFAACDNSANSDADNINDSITDQNRETASLDNSAQKFAEKAAMGSMMEIEAGKIAAEKATNPDVKALAQKMVDDHSKISDDLKAVAASKNMVLPTMLSESQQKDLNDLREKTGNEFDKAFVNMMVDDHKDDVDAFQDAADKLDDPDIKNFAINTLPILQKHLASVQEIEKRIK